jgi:DNA-directed RNA polymerase specialized sigma24 family protein
LYSPVVIEEPLAAGVRDEPASFEAFFVDTFPALARGMLLVTGDPGLAEELAQEALVRVYERWPRVRAMASPAGYAYRIAINLHRKRLRALSVRRRHLPSLAASLPDPAELATDTRVIRDAVAALPREQQAALPR